MHRGVDDGGESNYYGCNVVRGPSFGIVGNRTLIVGPHTAAAIIHNNDADNNNNNNNNDDRRLDRGALCPPPLVHSIPLDASCHC